MDCLFCKIVNKEFGAEVIYENDYVTAFKDIHPVAPVHVLIVPKIHITSMNDVNSDNANYIAEIYKAVPEIAKICGVNEKGFRVICNCGEDGGQVIHHIHFHLIGGKHLGPKIVMD